MAAFRPAVVPVVDRRPSRRAGGGRWTGHGPGHPTADGAASAPVGGAAPPTAAGAATNGVLRERRASTDEVWGRVQLARNLHRPRTLEFIAAMADDFIELHGDRLFGDDEAMVAGLARIAGRRVVVIGQQKGADTEENIRRNFGMPHPEGYRKAMRVMELAERVRPAGHHVRRRARGPPGPGIGGARHRRGDRPFDRADEPAAHADRGGHHRRGRIGRGAGHRGRATSSSPSRTRSTRSSVPRAARRSCGGPRTRRPPRPRRCGCRPPTSTPSASSTSSCAEPGEGAHAEPAETAKRLRAIIVDRLDALTELPTEALLESRYRRYRALGAYTEAAQPEVPERVDRGLADRLRDLLDPARRGMAPVTEAWSRDDPPAREEV